MPRLVHMTWVASQHRWTKMYRGVRYYVSTRELGTAPTQAASIIQANEWWEKKKAELDGKARPPAPGSPAALHALLEAWTGGAVATPQDAAAALMGMVAHFQANPIPPEVAQAVLGPERVAQLEAGADSLLSADAPPSDKSVGALFAAWVALQKQKAGAGKISAHRADNNRQALTHFRDFLGIHTEVAAIDEARWLSWFSFVAGKVAGGTWGEAHAGRVLAVARRFVRFLWELRLIELPRNLESDDLAITAAPKPIEIWTNDEIRAVLDKAGGQSRLHMYLMLNCGFNGKDVSDLRPEEVDWQAGIITRRRSKTRRQKNTPVVRYKLWPETFDLLQAWRTDDPAHVLLTHTGRLWVVGHEHEVGFARTDNVASNLKFYMKKAKVKRPPKALRATAASKLGEHPSYKFYIDYFLGHSPRSVTERSYYKPTDAEFFEALAWLEGALGLK